MTDIKESNPSEHCATIPHTIEQQRCPHCNSMYTPQPKGMHNWKNLFKRPTWNEIFILFMMVMVIASAFAYKHDVAICQKYVGMVCFSQDAWKNQSLTKPLDNGMMPKLNMDILKNITVTSNASSGT